MAQFTWLDPFTRTSAQEVADAAATVRARAMAAGYLVVRGLLPAADVRAVRTAILGPLMAAGWCDAEGCVEPQTPRRTEGEPDFMVVYDQVQRLEAFHRLSLHPALLGLYRALFAEDVLPHARNIARMMFPANNFHTTPPHQDHPLIGGTPETWTAWIPLGDCPLSLGGLAVMAGSHREGLLPVTPAPGAGGVAVDAAGLDYRWVGGDLEAGDVLTFHSRTVHTGLPNLTPDRMRLSADFRYQPRSQPIRADSLDPHFARLSWAEIYAGWSSTEGQYYWREMAPTLSER